MKLPGQNTKPNAEVAEDTQKTQRETFFKLAVSSASSAKSLRPLRSVSCFHEARS